MSKNSKSDEKPSIDFQIFIPVILIVLAACGYLIVNLERGTDIIRSVLVWVEYKLGWLYILVVIVTTIFSVWLIFGKYAKIKLCASGEKAQFSLFSWFCMLFFATMAASIMVWGFIEPTFYYTKPPYEMIPFSNKAIEWSLMQTMFHWGPQAYSLYVPFAVGIAYVLHVRKKPHLRVSAACETIIGTKLSKGPFGKLLDIFVIFGILGGMSTSFGMAVPVIIEGFSYITGIEKTLGLMIGVLISLTFVFGITVFRGLEKGIKALSHFNLILATVFITGILMLGPTVFTLKMFVNSIGLYINNFPRMLTFLDPIANQGFVESWTVFYWAWYLGFATSIGIFVAAISKGRTIREVAIGTTVIIALCAWALQAVFSSYTINLEMTGVLKVSEIISEFGQNRAVVEIVKTLPFGRIWVGLHTLLLFIFVATSLNSTSYTLATMGTKQLKGDEEPTNKAKILWIITLLTVTGTLTLIGGLEAIQVGSVLASVPLMGIVILLVLSVRKMLKEDTGFDVAKEYIYIEYDEETKKTVVTKK